jgi:YVTN family beta-propeller protein
LDAAATAASDTPLVGMPPILDPGNIYAADRPGNLSPSVARFPSRVYVPNSGSNTVDVIDPVSFKVIEHFAVGRNRSTLRPR